MTQAALQAPRPSLRSRVLWNRRILVGGVLAALAALAIAAGVLWRSKGPMPQQPTLERGLAALDEGDTAAARRCVMALRAIHGHEAEATLLRGAMLVKMGYYYPGIDELGKVQDQRAMAPRALTLIGEAWYYLGRHVEAQTAWRQVLDANPDAIEAHRWLAASYYDMGAITGALYHLERTATLDPTDQRPLRLLGLIYKDFERYEDAIPRYEESLRRDAKQPGWNEVRLELATCQIKQRLFRDALGTLQPCAHSPAVLVAQAECLHALDDPEKAKAALQKALAADPQYLEALVLSGSIALEDASHDEAIGYLQRAVASGPKDYMAHFKLAQAYAQADKPDLAADEQKIADHLRAVRKLFADLHQAAWNDPQNYGIRIRLAQLASELGRPDLEQMWLKSAAALEPADPAPGDQ